MFFALDADVEFTGIEKVTGPAASSRASAGRVLWLTTDAMRSPGRRTATGTGIFFGPVMKEWYSSSLATRWWAPRTSAHPCGSTISGVLGVLPP
ncbi:hypothetical protein [Streptomyces sp. NPDC001970]